VVKTFPGSVETEGSLLCHFYPVHKIHTAFPYHIFQQYLSTHAYLSQVISSPVTENLYALLTFSLRATCPTHPVLDLITLTILAEEHKLLMSS